MRLRVLSGPSVLSSLCFVLCLAKGAHARGPEWFEPADSAKPSTTSDSKGEAPKASPEGAAAEAPKAEEPKAEAPTPTVTPCPAPPPPVRVAKPKRAEPPPPRVEWYGWQTIATDLAAVAFVGAGAANEEEGGGGGVALLGLGTYLLGAPIVHAANGQVGKGFASFGLRVGAPVAGALGGLMLGTATCPEDNGWNDGHICPLGQAVLGSMLGLLAASTLDAAVLAKKEVRPRPAVSIAPSVLPTPRGTTFGLAGTF